jgi:hypothetical protein
MGTPSCSPWNTPLDDQAPPHYISRQSPGSWNVLSRAKNKIFLRNFFPKICLKMKILNPQICSQKWNPTLTSRDNDVYWNHQGKLSKSQIFGFKTQSDDLITLSEREEISKVTNFSTKKIFFVRKIFLKLPPDLQKVKAQNCTRFHPNSSSLGNNDVFWFHQGKFSKSTYSGFKTQSDYLFTYLKLARTRSRKFSQYHQISFLIPSN